VPLDPQGHNPHRLSQAVYRVRLNEPLEGFSIPGSEGQQVTKLQEHWWQVTVSTVQPNSPLPPNFVPAKPGPADLQPAPLIQSNHPRVVAAAQVAVGSANEPWEKAVRIEEYIHRILHVTEFSQAFAGAAETVQRRRGDCSEHAVLLAACCRAVGIPARLVAGLVYSEQDQGLMYHMWNEVWIRDRWIPLDATLGQGGVTAGHLRITESQGESQNIYELVTPVLGLVGKMKVELVTENEF
jgi:transglutaminase-like putative cysteine protease